MKAAAIGTLLFICALATPSFGQQKTYNWVAGNDETVRLDPGYYHSGPTYQPGSGTRVIHVDIDAQQPVTLAMVSAQEWNDAAQRPEIMSNLSFLCVQEHVVQTTYTCNLPLAAPMVLLVRDERNERGIFAGIGEVTRGRDHDKQQAPLQPANGERAGNADANRDRDRDRRDDNRAIYAGVDAVLGGRARRQFFYPNDVHILYYDWACTENCNLPDPPRPKLFDWVPGNSETVRLEPAAYYHGTTWAFGERDVIYHLGIEAQRPVTMAVVGVDDWNNALAQRLGKNLNNIEYTCLQQHVVRTTFTCKIPVVWSPSFLIILDERDGGYADHDKQVAGQSVPVASPGIVVTGQDSGRQFVAPNEIRLQGYLWSCVDACDQPDFGWVSHVNEKYPLTKVLKLYGATVVPDHDGEQVSVKVKSPVPMAVAMLPAKIAGQLYGKPDMFESAVEGSSCAQRGVENTTFQCTFNLADGPQSLVLLPEAGADIPPHKKTQVQVQAIQCVGNCGSLAK